MGTSGSFVFYFVGEMIRRKNPVALLKAFHLEFTTDEPVELVIKGNLSGMSEEESRKHIEEMCNQVKTNLKLYPDLSDYKEEKIMKVKVFEIVKTGLAPLSKELEETIQAWLNENENIEILTTSQSQHLRENTIFVTIIYKINAPDDTE